MFILGAGFSRAAGLPLGAQLTDLLLNETNLSEGDLDVVALLRQHLGEAANPESLADAIRQFSQLEILQARAFAPPSTEIEEVGGEVRTATTEEHEEDVRRSREFREQGAIWLGDAIPDALEQVLPTVVLSRHPTAVPEHVKRFVASLTSQDTVVTFNYDLLVEWALRETGTQYDLGFSSPVREGVQVLKLHGSIDWFALNMTGEIREGLVVLYDPALRSLDRDPRSWRLVREPRVERLQAAVSSTRHPIGDQSQGTFFKRAYPGLGSFKRVADVPGLWFVWRNAWAALRAATEVHVIGYSMPLADGFARLALSLFSGSRGVKLNRLVIHDPVESVDVGAFGRVFNGNAEHMRARAESIDWKAL